MKFEATKVTGIENAIIGMRLPMCRNLSEAIEKSDSNFNINYIGEKDLDLAKRLVRNGEPHCKFLRMIHVQVAITAPMYWWSEADTYKVGTVANSTSKMHKLASTPITRDCFECPDLIASDFINKLEETRQRYLRTKAPEDWKELLVNLSNSWLQTRMLDFNYSVIKRIYRDRKNHKLIEWHAFCDWAETLPYFNEFIK